MDVSDFFSLLGGGEGRVRGAREGGGGGGLVFIENPKGGGRVLQERGAEGLGECLWGIWEIVL